MNVFNELPTTQQIDLLTKWLTYADIACLDSATCSTNLRKELHLILSSPDCSFCSRLTVDDQKLGTWISERQIKLRVVHLTYNLMKNSSDRTPLLECIGKFIENLELSWKRYKAGPFPFDEIFCDICRTCSNLIDLTIADATIDGVLSLFIHNNKNLRKLRLDSCTNITNSILVACCSSASLRVLHLDDCTYSSTVPFVCPKVFSLCAELHISSVLLDDAQLCSLCRCFPVVEHLVLNLRSGSNLAVIASQCVGVQKGVIKLQSAPTVADVCNIATSWADIAVLDLDCVEDFPANTVLSILMRCVQLQYLCLVNNSAGGSPWCHYEAAENILSDSGSQLLELHTPFLSEVELQYVVMHCKGVHTLSISHTEPAQLVAGSAELALECIGDSSITSVSLENITNLTGSHLLHLRNLHELFLRNVGRFTDNEVTTAVAYSPQLHTIHIANCPGVTYRVVLPILRSCFTLRSVTYLASDDFTFPPAVRMLQEVVLELYPHLEEFTVSL